jgi:hypothetical protein
VTSPNMEISQSEAAAGGMETGVVESAPVRFLSNKIT